jgi:hypothetical protein
MKRRTFLGAAAGISIYKIMRPAFAQTPTPSPVPSPPPLPGALQAAKPKPLSEKDIVQNLQYIYAAPELKPYRALFTLLNLRTDRYIQAASEAQSHAPGFFEWPLYKVIDPAVGLQVKFQSQLQTTKAFTPPLGTDKLDYATFVSIEHRKSELPFHLAQTISAAFFSGLVTRYLLEQYKIACKFTIFPNGSFSLKPGPTPPVSPAKPARSADRWVDEYFDGLSKRATDPAQWNSAYFDSVYALSDPSLQIAGIIDGWRLVDKITDGDVKNDKAIPAVLSLMNSRYTSIELGKMVGYALFFLCGFVNSDRTIKAAQGKDPGALNSDPGSILSQYSKHTLDVGHDPNGGLAQTFDLVHKFYTTVLSDYYLLSQKQPKNDDLLAKYYNFLDGFQTGVDQSASALFLLFYKQGYEDGYDVGYAQGYKVGFTAGFSTGYSEGYSNGWQAGYSTGYSDGPGSFTGVLNGVVSQLGSNLGNISGIVNDLSTAGSIGSAIGALF